MPRKMLAGSAGDRTPPEVASDADRELQNRRNHNYAFGLVEKFLRIPSGMSKTSLNTWPHTSRRFFSLLSFAAKVGHARKMAMTRTLTFLMAWLPNICSILASSE